MRICALSRLAEGSVDQPHAPLEKNLDQFPALRPESKFPRFSALEADNRLCHAAIFLSKSGLRFEEPLVERDFGPVFIIWTDIPSRADCGHEIILYPAFSKGIRQAIHFGCEVPQKPGLFRSRYSPYLEDIDHFTVRARRRNDIRVILPRKRAPVLEHSSERKNRITGCPTNTTRSFIL